ncbi:MAG: hypothetical protein IT427_19140 [Pirellulales bacterium]|nr:hypothetical protein [Pirellulales bacterium]
MSVSGAVLVIGCPAPGATINYANPAGAQNFTLGANWVGGVAPGPTDIPVIDGVNGITDYPFIDSSVSIQRFSIAAANSSTMGGLELRSGANVTSTVDSAHYVGARGVGHLRVYDGATADLAGNLIVGWASTGTGTVNVDGGSLTTHDYLQIGRQGNGTVTQSGGALSVNRNSGDALVIAPFANAVGTYEISGGSFSVATSSGGTINGVSTGDSTGTFRVIGDAATSISLGQNYTQYDGSEIALEISTGITPIDVAANATLAGSLNVLFSATPNLGQQFTVMNYGGTLTGSFTTFDSLVDSPAGVDSVQLSIDYGTGTNSSIVLTVVPEPAGVLLAVIGGSLAMLWRRRSLTEEC